MISLPCKLFLTLTVCVRAVRLCNCVDLRREHARDGLRKEIIQSDDEGESNKVSLTAVLQPLLN